ncbi:tyrosine-protein phosphatase non-receptor type 4 [Plakobranchus ocellatus]|uniref:Tyrosine-protein phosphatase non-receptor type 4 n=1 Tax=Plakobranchus ocellatus TaxID=259542 RepID=A0AAV4C319_9GAST|nr:tyrosine-protein phosphatase non-receptor type 4 [Plakobranchus ocellatus]
MPGGRDTVLAIFKTMVVLFMATPSTWQSDFGNRRSQQNDWDPPEENEDSGKLAKSRQLFQYEECEQYTNWHDSLKVRHRLQQQSKQQEQLKLLQKPSLPDQNPLEQWAVGLKHHGEHRQVMTKSIDQKQQASAGNEAVTFDLEKSPHSGHQRIQEPILPGSRHHQPDSIFSPCYHKPNLLSHDQFENIKHQERGDLRVSGNDLHNSWNGHHSPVSLEHRHEIHQPSHSSIQTINRYPPKSLSPQEQHFQAQKGQTWNGYHSPVSLEHRHEIHQPSHSSIQTINRYSPKPSFPQEQHFQAPKGQHHQPQRIEIRRQVIGPSVAYSLVAVHHKDKSLGSLPNGNGFSDGHGLVTIRMKPDEKGRFGFNVKGGADQGMPIIVSRVAPNTPADLAIPRLNEGDQVLLINGRDVSQHTHEQVVMFIKASRETHSGELALVVRPNVYVSEEQVEEPDFTYIPDTHQIASSSSANTLQSSLMLLQESLESGAAIAQFEQLYRKKPGLTLNAARLDANINKNRYRDISPYDQTRVVLKNGSSGDYINANYVNMEIPGSGIVNRYIAAQGPLPNTCTDFWQMVWEQQSSLVVMLTTEVERGRVKCHQYWPLLYETEDFGELQVTCEKEEDTHSFAFREFNLTHAGTGEERHIRHMQYIAWPDHGVPDDPSDFLHFVARVRQNREGMVEPTIVHCSAGIGRTGVLITMETAMCLIESNQPVYPLSIVKQMRDQRAMLIQTSSQYKFVCEAILRVYNAPTMTVSSSSSSHPQRDWSSPLRTLGNE